MYQYECEKGHVNLYKSEICYQKAVAKKQCAKCNAFTRNRTNVPTRICPQCNSVIVYKTKSGVITSNKQNSVCRDCQKLNFTGEGNHFYGKHHSQELKEKFRLERVGVPISETHKEKIRIYAQTHKHGGTPFPFWVKKYGEEVAQQKLKESNAKKSVASAGKGNPMYGKPSPNGAGNGWSGWYKGWFFRSLLELSYVIEHIEANNYTWINAESVEYRVKYFDYEGKERNYYPDFVLPDLKQIIEVKPLKLFNTPKVLAKKLAAIDFFAAKGYEYKLVSCEKMSFERLNDLVENKSIKFLPKYQQKFEDWKQRNA